jgi:hypothetical protein
MGDFTGKSELEKDFASVVKNFQNLEFRMRLRIWRAKSK